MMLQEGTIIKARTHTEFLNKTFNKNYKGYQRSVCNIDFETVVWFIRIDGCSRSKYKNYFINDDIIEESNKPTRSTRPYRLVFKINDVKPIREYVYLGKYYYNKEKSSKTIRYFSKLQEK